MNNINISLILRVFILVVSLIFFLKVNISYAFQEVQLEKTVNYQQQSESSQQMFNNFKWGNTVKNLTCCIVTKRYQYTVGEDINIKLMVMNSGDRKVFLPLHFFQYENNNNNIVVASRSKEYGGERPFVSLEIKSVKHGNIKFDNFGLYSYLPPIQVKEIAPRKILTSNIYFNKTSTFILNERSEIFGTDHNGLNIQGEYLIKAIIDVPKDGKNQWWGHIISNEIKIQIRKEEKSSTRPN